jgi:hypothetical protein
MTIKKCFGAGIEEYNESITHNSRTFRQESNPGASNTKQIIKYDNHVSNFGLYK